MDNNQIVFEVSGFKPPKFPLPGSRRLVVLKNTDEKNKNGKAFFFFSYSDRLITSLYNIYEVLTKKSDYKDKESLRWHPREGEHDDYFEFTDNRDITESCMVEMCKAYNKAAFGIGKPYDYSAPSVYYQEHKWAPVRRWDGTEGIKHDLGNLAYDIGASGFKGLEYDLEEYIKQLDEKFDGIIRAIREDLKKDPSTIKELW